MDGTPVTTVVDKPDVHRSVRSDEKFIFGHSVAIKRDVAGGLGFQPAANLNHWMSWLAKLMRAMQREA